MSNRMESGARQEASRGLRAVARVGYASKGVVYCVVGALALMAAFHEGGKLTDLKGAIAQLGAQPFGAALLWAVAAGLACYTLWNVVRAALDPEHHAPRKKALFARIGYALAAVSHGSLAVCAGSRAVGATHANGDTEDTVAKAMTMPFGRIAVVVAGVITIGFGAYQVYLAFKGKPDAPLQTEQMGPRERRMSKAVTRLGMIARGIVFPIIGTSLIVAAARANPDDVENFGEALAKVGSGPLGDILLTVVAAGLFAYGVLQLFAARYVALPARV